MNKIAVITGSDPSAGAGVELATRFFEHTKHYTFAIITTLTAQNSKGVKSFQYAPKNSFKDRLEIISSDFGIDMINLGLIWREEFIDIFINWYKNLKNQPPIIFDPVLKSSSEKNFYQNDQILKKGRKLLKLTTLITPNRYEGSILTGEDMDDIESIVAKFREMGVENGVITGGDDGGDYAIDHFFDSDSIESIVQERVDIEGGVHGTGTLFSAIFTHFYLQNFNIKSSVFKSKQLITHYLKNSIIKLGEGYHYFIFS